MNRAGLGMEAFDHLLVADPVEVDQAVSGDGGRGVTGARRQFPDERRRELAAEARFVRHAVVRWPEERRPVVRDGASRERAGRPVNDRPRWLCERPGREQDGGG